MAYIHVKSGYFLAERKKVQDIDSGLLLSAVGFIDASLWLIAGNRLAQALVMLDNAIEVALKGELHRRHPVLIARTRLDSRTLEELLSGAIPEHPSAGGADLPELDTEKTIGFNDAFARVARLHPGLDARWKERLVSSGRAGQEPLHALRNAIVHSGSDPELDGRYVEAIVETAFPFLEELFTLVTRGAVSLPHLLMEWIYREVAVAQRVLRDLRREGSPLDAYAIRTLQHHMLWTYAGWPSPRDDLDTITIRGETEWERYAKRQREELDGVWNDSLMVEVTCPVCHSQTGGGSDVPALVLLEEEPLDENRLVPEGFSCFVCGLHISPGERFLARHFVGEIPEETATAYLKDIGRL